MLREKRLHCIQFPNHTPLKTNNIKYLFVVDPVLPIKKTSVESSVSLITNHSVRKEQDLSNSYN